VREQPLPESSASPMKKGKIRPTIRNIPWDLYSGFDPADNPAQ
jgi:hypothetical protein